MADVTEAAVKSALGGFLQNATVEPGFSGETVPIGVPVTFKVVPASPQVNVPVLPVVPTEGNTGLPFSANLKIGSLVPLVLAVAPTITVTWQVLNEDGTPVTPDQNQREHIFDTVNSAASLLTATLTFHVHTHELKHTDDPDSPFTLNPLRLRRFLLQATVTASVTLPLPSDTTLPLGDGDPSVVAKRITTDSVTLPPVPLPVPSVGIPKLAVLSTFAALGSAQALDLGQDASDRAALLFVDTDSPFPSGDTLMAALETIQDVLAPVRSLTDSVTSLVDVVAFLAGLDLTVLSVARQAVAVAEAAHIPISFMRPLDGAHGILNLDAIHYGEGDDDFRHSIASVLVLGPEGAMLSLWNDTEDGTRYDDSGSSGDASIKLKLGSAGLCVIPWIGKPGDFLPKKGTNGAPIVTAVENGKDRPDLNAVGDVFKPSSNTGIEGIRWDLPPVP